MGDGVLGVTWAGHATALVAVDGLRILTDPALTPRSPTSAGTTPSRSARWQPTSS